MKTTLSDTLAELDKQVEHLVSVLRTTSDQSTVVGSMLHALYTCLQTGGTVYFCGNGGSAADCQHLAAEMMGRFKDHRRYGWPAVSLTTDTSVLTAIANDYGYEHVFERQVQVLCGPADVLVCMSTSGTSKNVLLAAEAARRNESTVLAFTGHGGSALAALAHTTLIVPSTDTARIQEAHIFIGHVLCGLLEEELAQ